MRRRRMAKTKNGERAVSAEGLARAAAEAAGERGLPPVHLWDPPFCGDIDMRIARDGTWFYLGTPIGRKELVRLFAGIIRREGEAYFLVTPVEKVGITVEDAPFVAVDVERTEGGVAFVTNVGDRVVADAAHPVRVERESVTGEPRPYVRVRRNLEALIDRKSFYRLVEMGEVRDGWFGVASGGVFFAIIPEAELGG